MTTQTKMRHSQGPWTVNDRDESEIIAADGFKVADTDVVWYSPKWRAAHPSAHWGREKGKSFTERTEAEVEANARLIAAAPELLESCKAWIDWMDAPGDGTDKTMAEERKLLDAIRAAIALATGIDN